MIRSLAALAFASALFTACGGTGVDYWYEREFDVKGDAGGALTLTDEKMIDLTDELNKVQNPVLKVKQVQVPEIWVEIPTVDASSKATHLDVNAAYWDGTQFVSAGEIKGIAITAGAKVQVVLDTAKQAKMEELLLANKSVKVQYTYTVDQLPVSLHAKARVHLVATVGM